MTRTSWRAWSISCKRPSTTVSPASTSSSPGPILPGLSSISSGRRPGQRNLAQVHGCGFGADHGLRRAVTVTQDRRSWRVAARWLAQLFELLGRHQRLHGVGQLVVPIAVEAGGHVTHDPAHSQHVQVDEVAALVGPEIGIPEVAAAGDAHGVVGDEQLVVHALLDAGHVLQRRDDAADQRGARAGQGIEQSDLHVGLECQAQHLGVLSRRIEVVEQQPDPHAAPRGIAQRLQQDFGAGVGVDGVVLQVQAALGRLDQRQPAGKCCAYTVQQPEARITARALLRSALLHQLAERRLLRRVEGRRCRTLYVVRQARAAGNQARKADGQHPTQDKLPAKVRP